MRLGQSNAPAHGAERWLSPAATSSERYERNRDGMQGSSSSSRSYRTMEQEAHRTRRGITMPIGNAPFRFGRWFYRVESEGH
ncbi:unnamed protein product, partial [Mycena citricolor]